MFLKQQQQFARMVPKLLLKAFEMGFDVTIGDAYRDPRLHGDFGVKKGYGAAKSFHKIRQAIDINLFKDGVYLASSEHHEELGRYWESIGGTWGGRFDTPDGNHYSLGE